MSKRSQIPTLSLAGQQALAAYQNYLQTELDVRPATWRNYLSDLRHFMAWCETGWATELESAPAFQPSAITTPLLTRYRSYLQTELELKPASVNRSLISLKKYCGWASEQGWLPRNPAKVVKLVAEQASTPRHLSDSEEEALVRAVEAGGNRRDQALIYMLLHTGLRAGEICQLKSEAVQQGKRSGSVRVVGKGNKYREVPLNVTVRQALAHYKPNLAQESGYLFLSEKTGQALSARGLGYVVKKYAKAAKLTDLSPHDLRHRFGYRMAEKVPLHRLAQLMGHSSLDTTLLYIRASAADLQKEVEKIAWQ